MADWRGYMINEENLKDLNTDELIELLATLEGMDDALEKMEVGKNEFK